MPSVASALTSAVHATTEVGMHDVGVTLLCDLGTVDAGDGDDDDGETGVLSSLNLLYAHPTMA